MTAGGFNKTGFEVLGSITVGKTPYTVYALPTPGEATQASGARKHLALEGKTGASYFVTDYGPDFRINSVCVGGSRVQRWTPAPRPLAGLTRAHVLPFLTSAEAR